MNPSSDQIHQTEMGRKFDTFNQSREMEIFRNLQALQSSFQVFEDNFSELTQLLEPLQNPGEAILKYAAPDKEKDLENLFKAAKRLLHNFLASARSLVDHTRVVVNRLYPEGNSFRAEYSKRLKQELINNSLQNFVKELRNYTQHYALPVLGFKLAFTTGASDLSTTLQIDTEKLKQWDNWKSSRAYLDSLDGELSIANLAHEYHMLIQGFYNWLSERQSEIHQADLDNLEKMRQDLLL